jgi:hypothetical protein
LFFDFLNIFNRINIFLAISETIAATVVNNTPPKRSRLIPTKKPLIIPSIEDENNLIQSTMSDLLDRCSSSSFDNEIRLCLNDLCQRVVFIVDQSLTTEVYNQLPSPVFKRKIEKQIDEELIKKNNNQLLRKKSLIDNGIEQELSDVKTFISTNTLDYNCEWENCRL